MYLFFDCETGGLNPRTTSLLEISLAVWDGHGSPSDIPYDQRLTVAMQPFDGIYHVSPDALRVNRIDLTDRRYQLYSYGGAAIAITDWINARRPKDRFVPVGWNVPFDLAFVYEHLFEKVIWDNLTSYRNIDIQSVVRMLTDMGFLNLKKNSLVDVARYFAIDIQGAHGSARDVQITMEVYARIRDLLRELQDGSYAGAYDGSRKLELPLSQSDESVPAVST